MVPVSRQMQPTIGQTPVWSSFFGKTNSEGVSKAPSPALPLLSGPLEASWQAPGTSRPPAEADTTPQSCLIRPCAMHLEEVVELLSDAADLGIIFLVDTRRPRPLRVPGSVSGLAERCVQLEHGA